MGWIIFAVIVIPLIAVFIWVLLDESFIRVEPGHLGLILRKGRPTDQSVDPGVHWVPALRRRTIETYPSVELSLRIGDAAAAAGPVGELEQTGPSTHVCLMDRTRGVVGYTLRFRLDIARLRTIHERFGASGFWSATRDVSESTIGRRLAVTGVDDLFADRRVETEAMLLDALNAELGVAGIVVTMFRLTDVDLGQTSAVMEATARARHELDREQAESGMRLIRAQNDANLAPFAGAGTDVALRYREVDSFRELARTANVVVPVPSRPPADQPAEAEPSSATVQEPGVSRGAANKNRNHRILEVLAVALLGIATIGSAWCGYQASRWNGEEGDLSREASNLQVEAGRQFGLATQTISYDSNIVAEYAAAVSNSNTRLEEFIRTALVRPAFLPLLDEWRQQVAAGETPTNLLNDQDYLDTQLSPYRATEDAAAAKTSAAVDAGDNADDYILTTLLFASALFFAGLITSFRVRFAQFLLLTGATVLIGYAAARLSGLPVA